MLRERLKWLLFPGLNLNARLRDRVLPTFIGRPQPGEERVILDAGCGNGMLSWRAYELGNRVVGVSIKDEVIRNRELFHGHLAIPKHRLEFRDLNLYDIESIGMQFDEIICCEVLEHIRGDEQICRSLLHILKPGGVLHLCCPNADHPINATYSLDLDESGGHVRPGYTHETYRRLLEPLGFRVSDPIGLGGPIRQFCNTWITRAQKIGKLYLGLPAFLLLRWWPLFDSSSPHPPFSLYVRATKPD